MIRQQNLVIVTFGIRFVVWLLLLTWISSALSEPFGELEIKAAFILKFAQFTDWPQDATKEFNVCILGSEASGYAPAMLQGQTIKEVPVRIRRRTAPPDDGNQCQLLFLGPASRQQLTQWIESVRKLPVLTISDHPDAWDSGVMIAMYSEQGHISFRIDNTQGHHVGISFRAQMLQIAQEVR